MSTVILSLYGGSMRKLLLTTFVFVLTGCATIGGPEWLKHPAFSLSIALHDEKGKAYLDRDGICHVFMPYTIESTLAGIDDQLELCLASGAGKELSLVKREGVKHFRFYPVEASHQVGQRSFDLKKTKVTPGAAVCVPACPDIAFTSPQGNHCVIVYVRKYVDRYGREDKGVLSHEILHGFVNDFHRPPPYHSHWYPRELWSKSGMRCG